MEEIREFRLSDVPDVANLYLRVVRGQTRPAPPSLEQAMRTYFFENPWLSDEIFFAGFYWTAARWPAFWGHSRPMEFRGRPIRAATIPLWFVDHKLHRGLGGMKLVSRLFKGPQDFSMNDGAGNEASAIYGAVGARVSRVYSFRLDADLPPFPNGRSYLKSGRLSMLKGPSGLATGPLDFLLSKARPPCSGLRNRPSPANPRLPRSCSPASRRLATGSAAARLLPAFFRLVDPTSRRRPGHTGLRLRIVQNPEGEPCGWFIYYANPGQIAYVLQMGCHRATQFPDVLSAVFQDAWSRAPAPSKAGRCPSFWSRSRSNTASSASPTHP